jgi:asparagine synthase (glutamine-hydrolysing)
VSGICGVVNLDGRPIEPGLLDAMVVRMSHRGPDGIRRWVEGSIALAHAALHTTPESLHEVQPATSRSGLLCITFDGRIDNRVEIKTAVEDKAITVRTNTDSELVLKAYELWGEACASRILGDFAFAIWDASRHQLFCARDILGLRPFYYYHDERRFVFASELAQILEDPIINRGMNEGMIGEFLSVRITNVEETLYRAIHRLPPAHFLVVGREKFFKRRYWDIDLQKRVRYANEEDYSSQFFEIFREAVRCRLRSIGPVGAELSGGLDSASVVGMAQYLIREGALSARAFETFSDVFPGLRCDETPYIRDVQRLWSLRSNQIVPTIDSGRFADEVRKHRYVPIDPTGRLADDMVEMQARRGFRVILTGWGGDHSLAGDEYPHADLLRSLRIGPLVQQIRSDRAQRGFVQSCRLFLAQGALPLLPEILRLGLGRVRNATGRGPFPWISPDFAKRIRLQDRTQVRHPGQFQSYAQKARYAGIANGWTPFSAELLDLLLADHGIERRHPFFDRRVIEFAFALPQEQLCLGGVTKMVLRKAMFDLLPKSVRERTSKAEFSFVFGDVFESIGGDRLFDSLYIASLNLVDAQQVGAMYRELLRAYRSDRNFAGHRIWPVWMVLAVEFWCSMMNGPSPR